MTTLGLQSWDLWSPVMFAAHLEAKQDMGKSLESQVLFKQLNRLFKSYFLYQHGPLLKFLKTLKK